MRVVGAGDINLRIEGVFSPQLSGEGKGSFAPQRKCPCLCWDTKHENAGSRIAGLALVYPSQRSESGQGSDTDLKMMGMRFACAQRSDLKVVPYVVGTMLALF